jgi:hypothetical protein
VSGFVQGHDTEVIAGGAVAPVYIVPMIEPRQRGQHVVVAVHAAHPALDGSEIGIQHAVALYREGREQFGERFGTASQAVGGRLLRRLRAARSACSLRFSSACFAHRLGLAAQVSGERGGA